MLDHSGDPDVIAAHGVLRQYARDHNLTMADLAHALVSRALPPRVVLDHVCCSRTHGNVGVESSAPAQVLGDSASGQRWMEQEALRELAAHGHEPVSLLLGLDPFCDRQEAFGGGASLERPRRR